MTELPTIWGPMCDCGDYDGGWHQHNLNFQAQVEQVLAEHSDRTPTCGDQRERVQLPLLGDVAPTKD